MYSTTVTQTAIAEADPVGTNKAHEPAGPLSLQTLISANESPLVTATAEMDRPQSRDGFLDFYGLRENPFSDSVNPAYFYRTAGHEEACILQMLAVRHNISLGLVTGPSGSGKTLISQLILQQLDPQHHQAVLVLVTPGMSRTALLSEILSELGLPLPGGQFVPIHDLLHLLSDHIIELHGRGRKLVILIDECQFLSAENLHLLRTISNIEIPQRKLTTCLLFAEERFLKRLEHPSFESLRSRMYLRSELKPLTAGETGQYVKFRLLVAGRSEALFTESALTALHGVSEGIGRRINKLCMLALVDGYLQRHRFLDDPCIAAAAARFWGCGAAKAGGRDAVMTTRKSKTLLRLGRYNRPSLHDDARRLPASGSCSAEDRDAEAILLAAEPGRRSHGTVPVAHRGAVRHAW
jgi:type II secretory pathway predicted ATPase ExeA